MTQEPDTLPVEDHPEAPASPDAPEQVKATPLTVTPETPEEKTQTKLALAVGNRERQLVSIDDLSADLDFRKQALMLAATLTAPNDWTDFGGKPYLAGAGADRIAAVLGIDVESPIFDIKEVGVDFYVTCTVIVRWRGRTRTGLGTCDTMDTFFTGAKGDTPGATLGKALDRAGGDMARAKMSILGSVKKKANENAVGRGVCQLLGLRALTWSELERLGIRRGEGGVVKFGGGGGGDGKQATRQSDQKPRSRRTQKPEDDKKYKGKLGINLVAEMLSVGEWCATIGRIDTYSSKVVKPNSGPNAGQQVRMIDATLVDLDGPANLRITFWPSGDVPEWFVRGATVRIMRLRAKEFRDAITFIADEWENAEGPAA